MENLRQYLINWLNTTHDPFGEMERCGIRVTTDDRYPNLFNLKYGVVSVGKSSPLVRACRGAVVELVENDGDHSPYFRLVAYAFDRFFNLGESGAHTLNWATTKAYEKLDGSMMKCFFYKGEWLVSTSGSVAAASQVHGTSKTFSELFWEVFHQVGYSRDSLNTDMCYVFELCHRDNKVVVDYLEPQLPLLTVRDRTQDFLELSLEDFARENGFNVPASYQLGSSKDASNFVNGRGSGHEGVVLYDGRGRVKSKSDLYCQLHKAYNNGSPNFSELFLSGDLDEFLLHFPEFSSEFNMSLLKIERMGIAVNSNLKEFNHLGQKEFAMKVLETSPEAASACFDLRAGRYSRFEAWLEARTPQQLDRLLKCYNMGVAEEG